MRERFLDCFTMLASVIVCFAIAPRNVDKKAMHYLKSVTTWQVESD